MTYFLYGKVGVLNGYAPDPESKKTKVRFDPPISGVVIIGGSKIPIPVENGEAFILTDKIMTAKDLSFIDSKGKVYALETVGGDLRGLVRSLAGDVGKLQEKLAEQEKRLAAIEKDFYPKDNGLF